LVVVMEELVTLVTMVLRVLKVPGDQLVAVVRVAQEDYLDDRVERVTQA